MSNPPRSSDDVLTFTFDTDTTDPNVDVVTTIADLEDVAVEELPALYDTIDQVLEHLYSRPPSPTADLQIAFSYHGYRVVLEQDGTATFYPDETPIASS